MVDVHRLVPVHMDAEPAAGLRLLAAMNCAGCQEVHQLVAVKLHHGSRDLAAAAVLVPVRNAKDLADGPRSYALKAKRTIHGEGLACPCLAVGKHCNIVTVNSRLHQIAARLKDLFLAPRREHAIKRKARTIRFGSHDQCHGILGMCDASISQLKLPSVQRAYTTENSDRALQVFKGVVQPPPTKLGLLDVSGSNAKLFGTSHSF
mmetsp:Transcript_2342/g.6904  ORF Transcript_2342/g.6904 Transcript_2342/m.6904 type:complete len:205 (+) Transcript_2342:671-1285(+)